MIITETDRLILRYFQIFDAEALNDVFGDAEVMHFGPGTQTQEWIANWLHDCLENYYPKLGFGPWAVVEKIRRTVIGYSGLFYFPDIGGQPEIELGYRLARRVWGQGYATEAGRAVRDDSFSVLGLLRLIALIDPQNVASLRVAAQLGMRYEQEVMLAGYTHPDHVYSIANPMAVTSAKITGDYSQVLKPPTFGGGLSNFHVKVGRAIFLVGRGYNYRIGAKRKILRNEG